MMKTQHSWSPLSVAFLALSIAEAPAMAQQVETYTVSQWDYTVSLPGVPDGNNGLDFVFTRVLTTIDFTPGAVNFQGQPVDFDGTEAQFLGTSYSGTFNVPVSSGPATVPATGNGTATGPAFTQPQNFDFIFPNLNLGPGFSNSNFDIVPGPTDWQTAFPSWQSAVVPELNGADVFFVGPQDIQNVNPNTGGGTAQFSLFQVGTHAIFAVPEPGALLLSVLASAGLFLLAWRRRSGRTR